MAENKPGFVKYLTAFFEALFVSLKTTKRSTSKPYNPASLPFNYNYLAGDSPDKNAFLFKKGKATKDGKPGATDQVNNSHQTGFSNKWLFTFLNFLCLIVSLYLICLALDVNDILDESIDHFLSLN